jgi:hypothetical protein
MGVVDASTKEILTLLIADAQGDQAQAEAAS